MKLSKAIADAYNRNWSMVNTFTVQIDVTEEILKNKKIEFGPEINLNIISLTTPDLNNTPIEIWVSNRWIIQNSRDELYRFSMTFRDEDQMKLYKKFLTIYQYTKEKYFDDVALTITVTKDADWSNEVDKKIMILDGAIIEGISNLSFSNDTENQIAEFSVSFKCNKPDFLIEE